MKHLIPSRQTRPAGDVIFSLAQEANRRKTSGEEIINATIGAALSEKGELAVLPTVLSTLRTVSDHEIAAYAPIGGHAGFLRAASTDLLASEPLLLNSATSVATPGGTGALKLALENYLEHGQAVLTTDYYWGPYQTLADESDRKVETFRMFDENENFDTKSLDTALLKLREKQGRILLFLNDPCHNPTGFSMNEAEWIETVRILCEHAKFAPITLLVDTAYIDYGSGDTRAFCKQLTPLLEGNVGLLFAYSASKAYTLYGGRVGALMACVKDDTERAQVQATLAYSCRGTWSNCNHAAMVAVMKCIETPELRDKCVSERSALKFDLLERVRIFNEHAKGKLHYPRYLGGFFVTVFTATPSEAKVKAERMKQDGVFVVPQGNGLRVAMCSVAKKDIEKLVTSLKS